MMGTATGVSRYKDCLANFTVFFPTSKRHVQTTSESQLYKYVHREGGRTIDEKSDGKDTRRRHIDQGENAVSPVAI